MVELLTEQLEPLEAAELTVTLGNEAAGIEPIVRQATRQEDRTWRAVGFVLPVAGTWSIAINARVSTFDQRSVAGAIAIRDPNALAPAEALVAAAEGDHEHVAGPAIDLTDPAQVIAVDGPNAPTIAMAVAEAGGGLWDLVFTLRNFRFGTAEDGLQHIDGVGHAHVFVNGQYVAQLDAPSYRLELPANGVFEIVVGLNSLDHRALVVDGGLVAARIVLGVTDRTSITADRQIVDVPIALDGEPPTIEVRQGDTVELRLISPDEQVVHLHGYDIEIAVGPKTPVAVIFNASFAGRFVAEAHDANETPAFFVEVRP